MKIHLKSLLVSYLKLAAERIISSINAGIKASSLNT